VVAPPTPPVTEERLATFLPRDYRQVPLVQVDPEVVGPAVERAILEVLPEVVEAILRHALGSSTAFRELVSASVDEAVRDALPEVATRVVRERLAQLEASVDGSS
jgi:Arc/MetJ family transcription regulator